MTIMNIQLIVILIMNGLCLTIEVNIVSYAQCSQIGQIINMIKKFANKYVKSPYHIFGIC